MIKSCSTNHAMEDMPPVRVQHKRDVDHELTEALHARKERHN